MSQFCQACLKGVRTIDVWPLYWGQPKVRDHHDYSKFLTRGSSNSFRGAESPKTLNMGCCGVGMSGLCLWETLCLIIWRWSCSDLPWYIMPLMLTARTLRSELIRWEPNSSEPISPVRIRIVWQGLAPWQPGCMVSCHSPTFQCGPRSRVSGRLGRLAFGGVDSTGQSQVMCVV